MDGLLVIDKPAGITSHDVVARVRRILRTKRVGHTGTLDPFATGVMVVVVGRATRLAQFLDKDEKEYEATVRFGFETDTGDATGSPKSKVQSPKSVSFAEVESVLPRFRGEIEQIPPMYSAKKVDGKKLYESARKGIEVARKAQLVRIADLRASVPPAVAGGLSQGIDDVVLHVTCSAGTYIRTLAEDIGRALGIGAHLTDLRRTRSGRFTIDDSLTLDQLSGMDKASIALLPIERAVEHLQEFKLWPERLGATQNGMSTRVVDAEFRDGQTVRMISPDGDLIAIGVYSSEDAAVKPKVVLV
jgi:tRNA pseudouridine55 synthase